MNLRKDIYGILVAVTGALLLSGCALFQPVPDPTRFYILDVPDYSPVTEDAEEDVVVGLNRVQVARYLDAPGITVRERHNRVFHSQRHRWAESLEHGVARVLSETLSAEPAVRQVVGYPLQDRELPDYELHVSIRRAEGVIRGEADGHVAFRATWELRSRPEGTVVRKGAVAEDDIYWEGRNFDQLVAGLSEGVAEVSREVARAIADFR